MKKHGPDEAERFEKNVYDDLDCLLSDTPNYMDSEYYRQKIEEYWNDDPRTLFIIKNNSRKIHVRIKSIHRGVSRMETMVNSNSNPLYRYLNNIRLQKLEWLLG